MSRDEVHITDLEVTCIVGILPHERVSTQPLLVDVSVALDLTHAAIKNDLSFSLDYALLARQIQFILEVGKFELIETAALAIASWLAAPASEGLSYQVDTVHVRIRKPDALGGNGTAAVRVTRSGRDIKTSQEGEQDFIFRSERVALLRIKNAGTQNLPGPTGYPHTKDFSTDRPGGLRVAWQRDA